MWKQIRTNGHNKLDHSNMSSFKDGRENRKAYIQKKRIGTDVKSGIFDINIIRIFAIL